MKKSVDIRTLKNISHPTRYTIPDTRGLHLWVRTDLKKYWVLRYTFNGSRFDLSLGNFPAVTLQEARKQATKIRAKLLAGVNPVDERKLSRAETKRTKSCKFETYAIQYIDRVRPNWMLDKNERSWISAIKKYTFPEIGKISLEEITTEHIVNILNPIWQEKHQTATRIRAVMERIFSASITAGLRTKPNPAIWNGHLENLLPKVKYIVKHYPAMKYMEIPDFINYLYHLKTTSSLAIQFLILNASRTSEVLKANRNEISSDLWIIPADRMKAGKEHIVPLGERSKELICKAINNDVDSSYIFSIDGKHLSHQTMAKALAKYSKGVTIHGFRSTFRDWVAEETMHSNEVAEMALAHIISNKVEAAYRRGNLLEKRRIMMLEWERYCYSKVMNKIP
ncbi:tyrosine-type recombinase/integrase [Limnohabitans radicicola]|uniref:Integrase arm-type DNA-binding domain-containing protein n=1 Tax=Limnohabitans radicicola TaxID=2771427 RepID=A0A927FJT9_9BURK|nr:integrase arm-type DNA-binding domain-containing protein [Limnohabitans radicicola]MBD8051387.1 integrase arm-type DNA-binding domain-containing protein [Limnohabitans radicicola]